MKKNKKVIRRLGCCLLVGVVATTTVEPFNLNKKVKAFSTITVDTEGKKAVSNPKFLGLRDMYEWCSFIDKREFKTAEDVDNQPVYSSKMLYQNISIGTDRNGNEWYGDCIVLTFGTSSDYPSGSMPVFVNVRCYSFSVGVTEGIMPKGANVKYDGADVFAPAIEIGENALSNSSITKLYVPETYKLIADKAFKSRETLEEVLFIADEETEEKGSQLVAIGNEAFSDCSSLKSAILPVKLIEIGDEDLNDYSVVCNGPMGNNVYKNCKSIKSITINANEKNIVIPQKMFYGCDGIQNVLIKAKKVIVENYAFASANGLKEVTFNCASNIGSYAFSEDNVLEHVVFNGNVNFKELKGWGVVDSESVFYKSFLFGRV